MLPKGSFKIPLTSTATSPTFRERKILIRSIRGDLKARLLIGAINCRLHTNHLDWIDYGPGKLVVSRRLYRQTGVSGYLDRKCGIVAFHAPIAASVINVIELNRITCINYMFTERSADRSPNKFILN